MEELDEFFLKTLKKIQGGYHLKAIVIDQYGEKNVLTEREVEKPAILVRFCPLSYSAIVFDREV